MCSHATLLSWGALRPGRVKIYRELKNLYSQIEIVMASPRVSLPLGAQAQLRAAPKKTQPTANAIGRPPPPGTHVTVKSYDVLSGILRNITGYELIDPIKNLTPDHMYTEYDDGRESYIYRGGPGSGMRLDAHVAPAKQSVDYGRGERILHKRFIPGKSANEAVDPARRVAAQIKSERRPYLVVLSNSNTAAAEGNIAAFGRPGGDRQTWGAPSYRTSIPPMLGD
jgi:hypothetical protein